MQNFENEDKIPAQSFLVTTRINIRPVCTGLSERFTISQW